jgi:hypothetical protein
MNSVRFEQVSVTATRRWKDARGRKRQETKQFWQSINPWNVRADGLPKTRADILREVTEQRDDWLRATPAPTPEPKP